MNQDYHVFQGMRQDNPPIRQNTNFLWDAYNIRLTNRGDNSLLNVSNEKGNKELLTLEGRYVGHCIVGDYLVVFTVSRDKLSKKYYTSIYRIDKAFNIKTLISKLALAMNLAYIETLGVYEGEFVQKVYWVDGINQPRVINIVADKLAVEGGKIDSVDNYVYPEGCFDFIRNVKLVDYINIYREEGNGSFAPGVIQYAFSYPDRLHASFPRLDFKTCTQLTFEQPDTKRFRNLALAYEALDKGGNMPCIINAANEVVVSAFLNDRISFLGMSDVIEKCMQQVSFIEKPTYEDYVATDKLTRIMANELI